MFLTLSGVLCIFILITLSITSILNTFTIPRLNYFGRSKNTPFISILIPARNEELVLTQLLNTIKGLTYTNFEVIILDDNSTDTTYEIATLFVSQDQRFRIISGEPLPEGWLGKNWACHQLSQAARGELIIFTDADTIWQSHSLDAIVYLYQKYKPDMMSIFPTQTVVTLAERMVVPLLTYAILAYLPEILVRKSPLPAFSAANGQCLIFKQQSYLAIGGHSSVRGEIVEDMKLARLVKKKRLQLSIGLGNEYIHTRMYSDWQSVREGFTKNILAGYGNKPLYLLLSTLFHWYIYIFPWIWLLLNFFIHMKPISLEFPVAIIVLGFLIKMLTSATSKQNIADSFGMTFSVILMTIIAFNALYRWYTSKESNWKGRTIKIPRT